VERVEDFNKFDAELETPLDQPAAPFTVQQEADSFLGFMNTPMQGRAG
jgi:hypothetical protein